MLPRTHLLTTSSQMNNITPNVIEMPWSGGTKHHQRTSVIKFAIVKELQQFLIFFHFVLAVQPQGNYSEMFMYNAVKNSKPSFCRHLNVSRTWHSIYKNNEAVLNSSGYSFCAFKIITSNRPTHQVLVMLEMPSVKHLMESSKTIIQPILKKKTCIG